MDLVSIHSSMYFNLVTKMAGFQVTGETGPKNFVDPDLIQESFWTTLTVNNPNASECGEEPHEVAVMPSGADIDLYLPLEGFTADPAPY
jgi:hypothetical protein